MAEELCQNWKTNRERNLKSCLIFAVQGNAMDFFKAQQKPVEVVKKELAVEENADDANPEMDPDDIGDQDLESFWG